MAITIMINGEVTLDESAGLQNSGTATPPTEDNNDNDVSLDQLISEANAFYVALVDLGVDFAFAEASGVAKSADSFIAVDSGGSTISSIGFVDGDGLALTVYQSGIDPTSGTLTALTTVDGESIFLFADASTDLGNRMVLGVDSSGDIVFALYIDASSHLTSAAVWMVQFEAIANVDGTNNHDDPDNLFDSLGVAATGSLEFNFNALPSGQNLFGIVGDADAGLVVIGRDVVLKANDTYANTSNTINTSQGGGPTTIGINNQMFDPGEGAYFTLVKKPDPNFLSGVLGGLDQNEADNANNISFEDTLEVTSSFVKISQIQGNSPASMQVTAIDMDPEVTGKDFADNTDGDGIGKGTVRSLTKIEVVKADGTKLTFTGDGTLDGVTVDFQDLGAVTNGTAVISGLGAGYKVEWTTSGVHDQVLIEGVAGKFDIGGFGTTQAQPTPDQLLEFTVKITDGDLDTAVADFSIEIDGTGIYDSGNYENGVLV